MEKNNKLKQLGAALLALVLILSLSLCAFAASRESGFTDVEDDAWYAEAVAWCRERGIMNGVGGGAFNPDGTLTRAMLATSLYRAAEEPAVSGAPSFTDTKPGVWYSNAVVWADANRLMQGYGGGMFGTEDPVTREQLAAILWRYAGEESASQAQITDRNNVSKYAMTAVDWAVSKGIMSTQSNNSFAPQQSAARAEVAYALYAFLANRGTPAQAAYAPIPDAYRQEAAQKGTLQRVTYRSGGGNKYAYVYVPYGYNSSDASTRYEVFYVMHGGGGSAETYMGSDTSPDRFKNVIDNMVMNGDMEPMFLVFPSFYPSGDNDSSVANAGELTAKFHEELVNDLLPAVESRYHTYAETTDDAGLKASRTHRAFGGFSMGSVTTWYTFIHCLDYFSSFMPTSGDCWALGQQVSAANPEPTAEYLADVVRKSGYSKDDFRILAATGTNDIAYTMLNSQIEAMKAITDVFTFSQTIGTGNLHYILADGQSHTRAAACDYLYDTLRLLYPKTGDDAGTQTEGKALVAYFAYSENIGDTSGMTVDAVTSASLNASTNNTDGNLQVMAREIEAQAEADVFQIHVANPYDPDYSTMVSRADQERKNGQWPALRGKVTDLDRYDVIYLGTPVWYGSLPPALHTFLTENDLSGKKIILFGIHLGSGLGSMERELRELAPNAELVDSFTVSASASNATVREQFSQWLADLKI